MEVESIETFFNTRCKIGNTDEASTSRSFYIEADFGFFDSPREPKPFVVSPQDCYSEPDEKAVAKLFSMMYVICLKEKEDFIKLFLL